MTTLRVALIQFNSTVGAIETNIDRLATLITEAADAGADLVIAPEMVIPGYPVEDLALRTSFQQAAEDGLSRLASLLSNLADTHVLVGSLGATQGGKPMNVAAHIHAGAVRGRYAKHHLPNYGVFDEYRIFAAGQEPLVIEVSGARIAVAICEDIWQGGGPISELASEGIDLLAVLNGSPFEVGKLDLRGQHAQARGTELGAAVAYCNLVGGQDDLVFDGGSFFTDSSGKVLATAQFIETLHLADLDISTGRWSAVGQSTVAADTTGYASDISQIYDAIVLGLRDYAYKTGFRSAVLGLSGGIDSALVAAIAADALGPENVIGVSMPSEFSSDHSRLDAAASGQAIGLDFRIQSIEPMVSSFQSELDLQGIALENLQARMRGVILMAISNSEGALVLATGNKSELAVGYSTIYGDAVGGFAPLKDVPKTLVWELARHRNQQALSAGEDAWIPENSITKAPSAELRPDQRDDQSLPPYDVLDQVLVGYVEHNLSRSALLEAGHPAEAVDLALRLVDRAEWKRRQYPLGPKVTALAFGRDRRLPVTSAFKEWKEGNTQ